MPRLIDANALICQLYNTASTTQDPYDDIKKFYHESGFNSGLVAASTIVAKAPTVDAVEVVHGRWIQDVVEGFSPFTDSPIWIDVMQCSVCKEYFDASHPKNYCPNCGAKMDGDGNG